MEEPAITDQKIPEENLIEAQLKDATVPDIPQPSAESPLVGAISEDLPDVGLETLSEAEKTLGLEAKEPEPLSAKEETFQVNLEPKPTETPPLLLLESKSQVLGDDSVFSGDLSTMPDQILAESPKHDELDERTEHEIASNIEEQLREFEGSEDDISLDKQISIQPSIASTEITRPEDIFGEDMSGEMTLGTTQSVEKADETVPAVEKEIFNLSLTQDKETDELGEQESEKVEDGHKLEGNQPDIVQGLSEKQTEISSTEENQTNEDSSSAEKAQNQEEPAQESPMDVDDKPPDENITEENSSGCLNQTMDFEDVEMRSADDSKEKSDILIESEDPLSKSDRVEDDDKTEEDGLEKEEGVSESMMDVDVKDDEPVGSSSNILNDSSEDAEPEKVLSENESSVPENVEKDLSDQPKDEDEITKKNLTHEEERPSSETPTEIVDSEIKEKVCGDTPVEGTETIMQSVESDNQEMCAEVDAPAQEEVTEQNDAPAPETAEENEPPKETTPVEETSHVEKDAPTIEAEELASESTENENDITKSAEIAQETDAAVMEQEEDPGNAVENTAALSKEGVADGIVQSVQSEESEDVCLLPDSEKELTGAEKEQAILARENAEKEAEKADKSKGKRDDTRHSTPSEEIMNEDDHIAEEIEIPQENVLDLNEYEIKELNEDVRDEKCYKCRKAKPCRYKFLRNGEVKFLCDIKCVNSFRNTSKEVYTLSARKVIITSIVGAVQICVRCRAKKTCTFRFKDPDTGLFSFLCQTTCLNTYIGKNVEKYLVRRKKYIVEEMAQDMTQKCIHCNETKSCKYCFKHEEDFLYICNEDCFNLLSKEEPERYRLKQRRSIRVRELGSQSGSSQPEPEAKIVARTEQEAEAARIDRDASFVRRCAHCFSTIEVNDRTLYWEATDFCNELCLGKYQNVVGASCQMCKNNVPLQSLGKYCVRFGFDIRQFCCTTCLDRFKKGLKVCSFCQKDISKSKEGFLAPVGDKGQFKDFCSQNCMTRYDEVCNPRKKSQTGLCAVCNNEKVIRVEINLDNREHHFCSNPCFSAFKFVNNIYPDQCGMCMKFFERKSSESYTIYQDKTSKVFCCKICMNIYITLNRKIVPCQWCKVKKYNFDMIQKQCGPQSLMLCSLNCLTLYGVSLNAISMRQQKCDQCNRQATPQYHLTMSDASVRNFCTYQCVMIFQSQFGRAPWTIDNTGTAGGTGTKETNNKKSNTPFPTGLPKRVKGKPQQQVVQQPPDESSTVPIIANVASLAHTSEPAETNDAVVIKPLRKGRSRVITTKQDTSPVQSTSPQPSTPEINEDDQPLVRLRSLRSGAAQNLQLQDTPKIQASPPPPPKIITTNSHTQTKPVQKKSIGITAVIEGESPAEPVKPEMLDKSTMAMEKPAPTEKPKLRDREKSPSDKVEYKTQVVTLAPPPVAVANKQTMCKPATATKSSSCRPHSCSVQCQTDDDIGKKIIVPIPVPIYVPQPMYMYSAPFPVPVPIPLPIPVPIFIPTTRNSAEGILKEIKKIQDKMPTDPFEAELLMMAEMVAGDKKKNESDSDSEPEPPPPEEEYHPEPPEPTNSFGEDVLQMALKMATECDEPAVDLESAMTANTITPPATAQHISHEEPDDSNEMQHQMIMIDGQRQIIRGRKRPVTPTSPGLQPRNNRLSVTPPNKKPRRTDVQVIGQPEAAIKEPVEKPDANMCLKYTFGVNAWKQWVMTKNADLEKSSFKRKPFKSELLQLTADELNYSLCLFVKEVRKPNGSEYAPDTIYYLVLGIQQYLYENGRIDNIFTDPYYERFTDCLDEVAKKFSILYNDSQYIVTRVEEEHLWECKQLGAHSPHVLLSTLMFFNTKHFNLTTVEEHMQLSFSHIMKHWKRSPPGTKTTGTRNVLLRFYPPQSGLDANPRKKKVYEQQENEENPLRCPVKLYEFYLSKCPESVKTRNDVFYLQPERSCVPDSPVWYSTQPLSRDALSKMLHRVKMVKEINIALLTS